MLRYITANANTAKGAVRREMLEGREHLVVPVGMLAETVIAGSQGPVLYPKDQNVKSVPRWNGMPVVVYHPTIQGKFVSARDPDRFNARKVGVLLNSAHPGEKLMSEAWLDVERLKLVDSRVLEKIENGEAVETSTGLVAEVEAKVGEFEGREYKGVAFDYEPDHLAILPDQIGAFSINMGGGLFAANTAHEGVNEADVVAELAMQVDSFDLKLTVNGTSLPDGSFRIENAEDLKVAVRAVRRAKNQLVAMAHCRRRAQALGLLSLIPDDWSRFQIGNELSSDDVYSFLRKELSGKFGKPGEYWRGHIESVYDSKVVFFAEDGKLWMIGYTKSDTGAKLKSETPVEVVRTTDYRPVANVGGAQTKSETTVTNEEKIALVNSLIGTGGWAEDDRQYLMNMAPERLTKFKSAPTPPAATPAPTPPAAPAPAPGVTFQQLLANADPATKQAFADMQASYERERTELMNTVKGNPNNTFSDEALNAMALSNLRAIAQLARPQIGNTAMGGYDLSQELPGNNGTRFHLANGFPAQIDASKIPEPPIAPEMFPDSGN